MKAKIAILALVFIAGCGQTYHSTLITPEKISGTPKIKIEPINCNDPGGKAILEESLKQELQKKGYIITDSNADLIISGSATMGLRWGYYGNPSVIMTVIYIHDNAGVNCGSITSRSGEIVSPEKFAKVIVKKISKILQNNP